MSLLARRFTETEDDFFSPRNCLKPHHDLTDRFRNDKGGLTVWLEIVKVGDSSLDDD
jgi:hypothetical protein